MSTSLNWFYKMPIRASSWKSHGHKLLVSPTEEGILNINRVGSTNSVLCQAGFTLPSFQIFEDSKNATISYQIFVCIVIVFELSFSEQSVQQRDTSPLVHLDLISVWTTKTQY